MGKALESFTLLIAALAVLLALFSSDKRVRNAQAISKTLPPDLLVQVDQPFLQEPLQLLQLVLQTRPFVYRKLDFESTNPSAPCWPIGVYKDGGCITFARNQFTPLRETPNPCRSLATAGINVTIPAGIRNTLFNTSLRTPLLAGNGSVLQIRVRGTNNIETSSGGKLVLRSFNDEQTPFVVLNGSLTLNRAGPNENYIQSLVFSVSLNSTVAISLLQFLTDPLRTPSNSWTVVDASVVVRGSCPLVFN